MLPARSNNHVELIYRPGELELASKLLALLGCDTIALATPVAGTKYHSSRDQILWLSEVTAEQWAFELWLQGQLQTNGGRPTGTFMDNLRAFPQKYPHFGMGQASLAQWEAMVARLRAAASNDPQLAGRISLPLVARPGEPGSVVELTGGKSGHTIYQAFLRTNLISTGLLTLGQTIEIQHFRENDTTCDAAPAAAP